MFISRLRDSLNYLTTVPDNNVRYPLLEGAQNCIRLNLANLTGDNTSFVLSPLSASGGRFYFGDRNYGLSCDRWYSVSGHVNSLEQHRQAWIVLRINGQEQRSPLVPGNFHFVYDNSRQLVPQDVKLFIETTGTITLASDMVFSGGNYLLKKEYAQSALSLTYPFTLSGTIGFWYKPLIANTRGFVSYPLTFLDSEYLTISARVPPGEQEATFYACIKNEEGAPTVVLNSNHRVQSGWQYVQLSYSRENRLVHLYVDGELAAKQENAALPVHGSLIGQLGEGNNLYIGCNRSVDNFGEGFMDNLTIGNTFLPSRYPDSPLLQLAYDKETGKVNLTALPGPELVLTKWEMTTLDSSTTYKGVLLPGAFFSLRPDCPNTSLSGFIDPAAVMSFVPAGLYRLTVFYTVNNFQCIKELSFIVDNLPRFKLMDYTPNVFPGTPTDIRLTFAQDQTNHFGCVGLQYAGLALCLGVTNGEEYRGYLVQDFLNADTFRWLWGRSNGAGNVNTWTAVNLSEQGTLEINFPGIEADNDIAVSAQPFYFTNSFTEASTIPRFPHELPWLCTIPKAGIKPLQIVKYQEVYEYKLLIEVEGVERAVDLNYIISEGNEMVTAGNLELTEKVELFYDDILPHYGVYQITVMLTCNGSHISTQTCELNWKRPVTAGNQGGDDVPATLEIKDFAVLFLNKQQSTADLYFSYKSQHINELSAALFCNRRLSPEREEPLVSQVADYFLFRDVKLAEGLNTIRVELKGDGLMRSREIQVLLSGGVPEIFFTNTVPYYISCNTVFLSWKGMIGGKYSPDIQYQYNYDSSGWTTANSQWDSVKLFNLSEGYHTFMVKAVHHELDSPVATINFHVDVNKPQIDTALLRIEKKLNSSGILSAVIIEGAPKSIQDTTLETVYINGEKTDLRENGAFRSGELAVKKDGLNEFVIKAYDRVGNFSQGIITVDNTLTEIIYPVRGGNLCSAHRDRQAAASCAGGF